MKARITWLGLAAALTVGVAQPACAQEAGAAEAANQFPAMEPGTYHEVMRVLEVRGEVPDSVRRRQTADGSWRPQTHDFCYTAQVIGEATESIIEEYFKTGEEQVRFASAIVAGDQASGEVGMTSTGSRGYARYAGRFQPTSAQFALEIKMQIDEMTAPVIVEAEVTWTRTDENCTIGVVTAVPAK